MLRLTVILLISISFPAWPRGNAIILAPPGFQSNTFQQAQQMHVQTQQQLQAQDQYRRQLLMQDQQRQLQLILDQQSQIEFSNRSALMHQYSDRLKRYSHAIKQQTKPIKKATK